jgi:hypothetical protein
MTRLEKVARPFELVLAVLPEMAVVEGLVANVTLTPLSLTSLLYWSSTWTVGAGDIVAPATTLEGPWMKTNLFGAPELTVRVKLTAFE